MPAWWAQRDRGDRGVRCAACRSRCGGGQAPGRALKGHAAGVREPLKGSRKNLPHAVGRRQSWRESAARRSWGKTPLGAGAGRSAAAVLLKEAERESRERTHRRREASPFASLPAGVLAVAFPHAAPVSSQHRERGIPTKQSPARRLRRRLRTGPSIGPRNCTAGVPGGSCGGGECMSARAPAAARSLVARLRRSSAGRTRGYAPPNLAAGRR